MLVCACARVPAVRVDRERGGTQIRDFGDRMRVVVPARTQWVRDAMAPVRAWLGTNARPPASPSAPSDPVHPTDSGGA
jgi:hypothetical protein